MTINYKEPERLLFSDLEIGDTFKFKEYSNIYIKTEECFVRIFGTESKQNAFCLSSNELAFVLDSDEVVRLYAELFVS